MAGHVSVRLVWVRRLRLGWLWVGSQGKLWQGGLGTACSGPFRWVLVRRSGQVLVGLGQAQCVKAVKV